MTKLFIPPPRPHMVARLRLIERLDAGLRHGHRLTLISAPAGFGKTMLLADWLHQNHERRTMNNEELQTSPHPSSLIAGRFRVVWLSLDEDDNDPVQFLRYLIAALQQADEHIGLTAQQVLQAPQVSPLSLAASLINDIAARPTPLVLVLDDYHLITSTAIHAMLQLLLDRQPPSLHLVLATREDPPLPLPRIRARGQITELRERDLRFTTEEVAAFLRQTMSLDLSTAAAEALAARTEGWIAGLQLAGLALHENPADASAFIAAFTGDDRYIVDYLVAEVLQRLPAHLRSFVLQTSILDRLCGPLCDAVLGMTNDQRPTTNEDRGLKIEDRTVSTSEKRSSLLAPRPSNNSSFVVSYSQLLLEELERANLFLVPLDHRREWYRFHYLFAEFLRTRLSAEERRALHRRAADWYQAAGLPHEAIHHALAAGDTDRAERVMRLAAEEMIHSGNLLTVRGWLSALPGGRVRADGALATYNGWVLALSGELALAQEYASAAQAFYDEREEPQLGPLLVLRSFIAVLGQHDDAAAIELAAAALRALPAEQARWRIQALWTMAEAQERSGTIAEAIATLREACRAGRALSNQLFAAMAEFFLATALQLHGRRREAVTVCEAAIERYTDALGHVSPLAALLSSRLGMLHYEANQLEEASRHLEHGLALGKQLGLDVALLFTYAYAAPARHARGETGAALEHLQTAYQLASHIDVTDVGWILALEANIRLQQGDLSGVARWAETAGLSPDDAPHYLRGEQHLMYCRILLAQGRLSDARRLLARLERFVAERGLVRWQIAVYILQALAAEWAGDRALAHERLAEALRLAAPEHYVRAFLDEDVRLIALLPAVRHIDPAFVETLLSAVSRTEATGLRTESHIAPHSALSPQSSSLVEPLSEREREVLRLIAAGLSNPEIAQELVISVGTVKRHINHIYGKLGARSRTQAIVKARALRLLGTDG
jgi:LuxR family maltose regulon positive regulatory protein